MTRKLEILKGNFHIMLFDNMGISNNRYLTKPPQPEPGRGYSGTDFAKFPSFVPGTNWIEQPVWQTIDSGTVSVWCANNNLKFTVGDPKEKHWQITETEFENTERLEIIFLKYTQRIIALLSIQKTVFAQNTILNIGQQANTAFPKITGIRHW